MKILHLQKKKKETLEKAQLLYMFFFSNKNKYFFFILMEMYVFQSHQLLKRSLNVPLKSEQRIKIAMNPISSQDPYLQV